MSDATNALSDLADEADLDLGDLDDLSDYASSSDKSSKVSKYFALDKKTLTKAFNKADDFTEAKQMRNALLKTNSDGEYKLKISFDKKANKNLKNGDKVKCTVKYNEDSLKDKNIKLKNTEFEVTVKDLKTVRRSTSSRALRSSSQALTATALLTFHMTQHIHLSTMIMTTSQI